MVKKVLTIAGSDSLSGGGLQADLATFSTKGLAAFSVISSIAIIQGDGVRIQAVDDQTFAAQFESLEQVDHFDAIKVGLLCSVEQIDQTYHFLKGYLGPIVVDPVLSFKEGELAVEPEVLKAYLDRLLPLATVATPNLNEAIALAEQNYLPRTKSAAVALAKQLSARARCAIYLKAGQQILVDHQIDVLIDEDDHLSVIRHETIHSDGNNGAGCTLAAALTARLAFGDELYEAAQRAAEFTRQGILHAYTLSDKRSDGNVWPNWYLAKNK
ncbi:hydroxymethylpyrimidine/phosphomethylpyrimidine kinase [Fructobacillus sp. CRL 2054]|uniref:hydroxymethylpyrimidine/phosphomethylpyrimidine kinase n=1 Tax=Fructobacillus sp. CRL 2054 TaxID=2763007 RepID=UPI002379E4E7|nr:hydroxymethylpyrimidine/phosphomethylpyrimidine kinase [Fructobacillus sp. CRL 2054]MDD9138806.1 hydroxymethylpyrimidine/phosphomethylpyrimidine kinase [Fructobacillus sp. CRL 2054]